MFVNGAVFISEELCCCTKNGAGQHLFTHHKTDRQQGGRINS
jgi:hypothetical protein